MTVLATVLDDQVVLGTGWWWGRGGRDCRRWMRGGWRPNKGKTMINELDSEADRLRTTACRMASELGGVVTAHQVSRRLWRYRRPRMATALLERMVEKGFGRWEPWRTGPKGGRPTRLFVPSEGYAMWPPPLI